MTTLAPSRTSWHDVPETKTRRLDTRAVYATALGIIRTKVGDLTPEHWADGMTWYHDAHAFAKTLGHEHGAAIVAVLSPRVGWEQNRIDAERVANGERAKVALPMGEARAMRVLEGGDPDLVLGGDKVRAFWHNIAAPYNSLDVTLDTHMANVLGLDYKMLQRVGVYGAIADAFRTVADELGVMPHQLQAALWLGTRTSEVLVW